MSHFSPASFIQLQCLAQTVNFISILFHTLCLILSSTDLLLQAILYLHKLENYSPQPSLQNLASNHNFASYMLSPISFLAHLSSLSCFNGLSCENSMIYRLYPSKLNFLVRFVSHFFCADKICIVKSICYSINSNQLSLKIVFFAFSSIQPALMSLPIFAFFECSCIPTNCSYQTYLFI